MSRILIVGAGGREHALAWKLSQEAEVIGTPGNPGIAQVAECWQIDPSHHAELAQACLRSSIDLVVIGPEDPLIAGLADALRTHGIAVFGPGADAAQLEGSKAFSKQLMAEAGVPTAAFGVFEDPTAASEFARSRFDLGFGVAVKASGAALGKGVVVCGNVDEADDAIAMMLVDGELGEAGSTIVVEDRLNGFEFSLLTLVSGQDILSLPVAQDHKRALNGDRGPNTGGMGTFSPVPHVNHALVQQTEETVVRPILRGLADRQIEYRGMLFSGLMVQDGVPYCLEYNVRFGDPETQSVVRRLGSGFADALRACARGERIPRVEVVPGAAVTIVMASKGYPGRFERGIPIRIGELPPDVVAFHAGTKTQNGDLVTNGGRVLGISAVGANLEEAARRAYLGVDAIECDGLRWRTDIGIEPKQTP